MWIDKPSGAVPANGRRSSASMLARACLAAILLYVFCAPTRAELSTTSEAQPGKPLEEVLITGTWSGPKLWKISKGDHVLWLLGTPDVLPKHMTWESSEVEAVVAEADEVISSRPSFTAGMGLFGTARLYFQWRGMQKGTPLRDVLSEPLYLRFQTLKDRYAKNDNKVEKLRPMFAAGRLYLAAVDASGLTGRDIVDSRVRKLANKYDVKVNRIGIAIEDPKELLKELDTTSPEVEIACLDATVTRIETEIDSMTERAYAWASGDVDKLRRLPYQNEVVDCWDAITSAPRLRELRLRIENEWMTAAENALAAHRTTLALHSIAGLLSAHSVLDAFRARGYEVSGP